MTADGGFVEAEGLIGRDRERLVLEEFVAVVHGGPRVVVVIGEQGSGRTSVVELAAASAVSAGRRALIVSGVRGEETVALAGLSQLLLPFADKIAALPEAHRAALERPLGLASRDQPFDLVATGMAVIALLTGTADAAPLLVAVDDSDLLDGETLAVLAFVAKRVDRRRAVLLLSAEQDAVPVPFARDAEHLRLRTLTGAEALRLLERDGPALSSLRRREIVAQSGGNPLVLLETARAVPLPSVGAGPGREPLSLGAVVEERVMSRFRRLPESTRECLVDAAVAESFGTPTPSPTLVAPARLAALGAAEEAGLVRIDQAGVRFAHAAFWIAVYRSTSYTRRLEAHRRAADALPEFSAQRAWHLGRATVSPDDAVAILLESRAPEIGRQHGRVDEALMLERSAELSEDPDLRAQRLLAAAAIAAPAGELGWVDELLARARSSAKDARLRVTIATTSAWAAAARGRFSEAMAELGRAAVDTLESDPDAAWEVLSIAAAVGYQSGSRAAHAQMLGVGRRLAAAAAPASPAGAARALWIETFLRPGADRDERLERLETLSAAGPMDDPSLSRLAGAAWLQDESERAFDLADAAYHRLVDQGAHAAAAVIGPIRSWTTWDTGRWDDALVFSADASRVAEAAGGGMLQSTGDAVAALVHAVRGDADLSERHVQAALTLIQGQECRSILARTEQARGLSDLSAGNYAEAYGHFSRLFRDDGTPVHWHMSYFGVADLASSALRADHLRAARGLVTRILDGAPREPGTRLTQLFLRAQALLARHDDEAERFFDEAWNDPGGSRWPFERAQLLLDYGVWLRRRRRINDAKPLLVQAHDTFSRLGAGTWEDRAAGELRASHVDVQRSSGTLDDLTAQQREIVLLAGQGLTNREIAVKMYLSPRTVASHLYRSFPKLGIRDRWQLRDVIEPERRRADDARGPLS